MNYYYQEKKTHEGKIIPVITNLKTGAMVAQY